MYWIGSGSDRWAASSEVLGASSVTTGASIPTALGLEGEHPGAIARIPPMPRASVGAHDNLPIAANMKIPPQAEPRPFVDHAIPIDSARIDSAPA